MPFAHIAGEVGGSPTGGQLEVFQRSSISIFSTDIVTSSLNPPGGTALTVNWAFIDTGFSEFAILISRKKWGRLGEIHVVLFAWQQFTGLVIVQTRPSAV
jgi:hypothetical protein